MRILLVQTSFLGDTVLSTPLIAAVKNIHPDCELWMLTTLSGGELVQRDPLLAGVVVFDKRGVDAGVRGLIRKALQLGRMKFDRVYCLHRSYRSALLLFLARIPLRIGFAGARLDFLYHQKKIRPARLHDVERNLRILAGEADPAVLEQELRVFAPTLAELALPVRAIVEGQQRYAVLAPGSAWETKRWQVQGFREVARQLVERGLKVVIIGREDERPLAQQIAAGQDVVSLVGRTSIADTTGLIKSASLLVCNDSMVLHLASAFKTPTVVVFCSTSPEFGFGPWRNKAIVVEKKNLACKPCGRHGFHRCPLETQTCMRDVTAEEVMSAIRELGVI